MGCGSSSLKGDDIPPITASRVSAKGSTVSDATTISGTSNKLDSHSRSQGNQYYELSDDPDLTARKSIPANIENPKFHTSVSANDKSIPDYMINTPSIKVTDDPKDSSATKPVTGPGSSFRSKLSAGSWSFSSEQPKKKQALTEEDLMKYTGMSADQLKNWGDQKVYKGQKFETSGAAMASVGAGGTADGAF